MGTTGISRFISGVMVSVCFVLASWSAADAADGGRTVPKEGWPVHLRMLTGPNGGQWYSVGDRVAEVLSRNVLPTTSRAGGGVANINNVNDKVADIGLTLVSLLDPARTDKSGAQPVKTDNVVLMARVSPQVLYFLLRKDFAEKNGIDSVRTLLEKKVPVRFAETGHGVGIHSDEIAPVRVRYRFR